MANVIGTLYSGFYNKEDCTFKIGSYDIFKDEFCMDVVPFSLFVSDHYSTKYLSDISPYMGKKIKFENGNVVVYSTDLVIVENTLRTIRDTLIRDLSNQLESLNRHSLEVVRHISWDTSVSQLWEDYG